ncbi:chitin synthase activator [Moniliophthora roreri MCA 2997]|uniref:Chitin synthase activator n=2 Tax=Moniliophthora roreri TaxID=221103 RepID=V2XKQ2_MONRO|nr:chitin synthase activator [Moniliophthora roreri MCA 2997]KAI3622475.1 chitin synthase activator [Moniliophthora roreri]
MYASQAQQQPISQYSQPPHLPVPTYDYQQGSMRSRSRPQALDEQEFDGVDAGPDRYDGGYMPQQHPDDDFFNGDANGNLTPQYYADNSYPRSVTTQSIRAPSPPPGPILDHSHLRPGNQASLLSHERTLELYRANAKKTQDPDLQFEFAVFMIDASKSLPIPEEQSGNLLQVEKALEKREDLIREATGLLKRLADRGHPASQYFLADCYANGIGTPRNRQDFDRAYPLFVLAAKHGHPDAAYRAGTCLENGWGCRRESAKALQFFKKAAAASHPGASYRLGIAQLNGDLGLSKSAKEGVQWLKRSAENATAEFPHALHELALLHERGIDNVIFVDYEYATELLAQAAELGYAPSAYRLGECYEYGKMGCPQDPALSIHYYNIAAQQDHRDACFALTAWYLVGSPGVLPQSDTEAYLWAKKAAEAGLVKAMYAVGYFTEVGIGTPANMPDAIQWYKRAADSGDKRAIQRLKGSQTQAMRQPGGPGSVLHRDGNGEDADGKGKDKDKECVIM